jgi:hypothetical protein
MLKMKLAIASVFFVFFALIIFTTASNTVYGQSMKFGYARTFSQAPKIIGWAPDGDTTSFTSSQLLAQPMM